MAVVRDRYELVGIDKTREAFRSAETNSKKLLSVVSKIGGAFATIGGANALGRIVFGTAAAADELTKLTERLGGTVEGFSALRAAAKFSGVEFKQLVTGMQRLTRRIGQAAQGTGEAVDALDQLGLSAVKLRELNIEQQFSAIAEALSKVENESTRVALTQKLVDSEAVQLLQTFKDGSSGLQDYARRAAEAGAIVDSDLAGSATAAQDAFKDLSLAGQGTANALSANMLPAVAAVTEALASGLIVATNASGTAFREFSASVIRSVSVLNREVVGASQDITASILDIVGLDQLAATFRANGDAARGASEFMDDWADSTLTANKSTVTAEDIVNKFSVAMEEVAGRTKTAAANAKELADAQREFTTEQAKLLSLFNGLRTPAEIINAKVDEYNNLLDQGVISQETFTRAVNKAVVEYERANGATERAAKAARELADAQREVASLVESLRTPQEVLNDSTAEYAALLSQGAISQEDFNRAIARSTEDFEQASGATERAAKAARELAAEQDRLLDLVSSLRTPQEKLNDSFLEYNDLLNRGLINQETYNRAIERAQDSFDSLRPKIEETSEELSNFADEAGRNIEGALADFLFDPFQDGLDGMLKGFTDMLGRMAAEAAASQILDSFGGASGIGGFIGSIFGARANGGPAPAGASMLVGERGVPEVFTPSTNGTITPLGAGGGAVNVTVNMNGPTQGGRATANQIAAQVGGAVREAQARLR